KTPNAIAVCLMQRSKMHGPPAACASSGHAAAAPPSSVMNRCELLAAYPRACEQIGKVTGQSYARGYMKRLMVAFVGAALVGHYHRQWTIAPWADWINQCSHDAEPCGHHEFDPVAAEERRALMEATPGQIVWRRRGEIGMQVPGELPEPAFDAG